MADTPPDEDVDAAIRQVEKRILDSDAAPFTPQAYDQLKSQIAGYISELVDESARVARRHGSTDVISAADVKRASEHLGVRPRQRRYQVIGSFGSLLLGAAVGNALQIVGTQQIASETALLTFGVGAFGTALTVLGLVRE